MVDIEIAKKINEAGGRLYLVGGAVRDEILRKKISDEDYSVVGLSEEEFIKIFPNAIARGKNFKVFDIDKREFALARKEKKTAVEKALKSTGLEKVQNNLTKILSRG